MTDGFTWKANSTLGQGSKLIASTSDWTELFLQGSSRRGAATILTLRRMISGACHVARPGLLQEFSETPSDSRTGDRRLNNDPGGTVEI
jgi:hypothetical protein